MKVAVLSGKGGTGKTLLSVNLAALVDGSTYADCDVEEPDGHLFFRPVLTCSEDVAIAVPSVNGDLCDGCRKCVAFCRFHALGFANGHVIVFRDVCHACGACALVCPRGAITEIPHRIGHLEDGRAGKTRVISGFLEPGQESGVPIVRAITKRLNDDSPLTVIDCPPGSSCVAVESVRTADYCVLVAEPTRFGAHDLAMARDMLLSAGKPHGVVLNKTTGSADPSEEYCIAEGISIIGRIPFDATLGRIAARAGIAVKDPVYRAQFSAILADIETEVDHETPVDLKR